MLASLNMRSFEPLCWLALTLPLPVLEWLKSHPPMRKAVVLEAMRVPFVARVSALLSRCAINDTITFENRGLVSFLNEGSMSLLRQCWPKRSSQ